MSRAWASRFFFSVVAVMALAAVISGTACTRWGQPGAIPPSITPISSIFVNPVTGSDSSGNGTQTKPYKTLTKAVDVLGTSKSLAPNGVTINLSNGDYTAANGEKFPIVIPTAVSIMGMNFGTGVRNGTFIDGSGQDTIFEELVHAPARTAYTALEIAPGIIVSVSDLYVGASKLKLPNSRGVLVGRRSRQFERQSVQLWLWYRFESSQRERCAGRGRHAELHFLRDPGQ
jgi:hypothetical protein